MVWVEVYGTRQYRRMVHVNNRKLANRPQAVIYKHPDADRSDNRID